MRLITGDELGLLKEIVPELCRQREDVDDDSSSSIAATKFAGGSRLPAVYRLDLSLCADGATNNSSSIPGRSAGIVSLAFLPPSLSSSSESCFNFAALRSNGIVETWRGTRGGKDPNDNDNGEADITPASYIKGETLTNGVVVRTMNGDKYAETSAGDDVSSSSGGWYMNRPINPISMVSSYMINNHALDDTGENNGNPILVTCDSIGGLSVINANNFNVVAQYETFMADSDATSTSTITNVGTSSQLLQLLPLPSSSKNNPCNIGTLTYTKGTRANVDIATCLALTSSTSSVGVGGRERGTRLVNVETGAVVWKAKNLPPDSQTLLQRMMWTTCIKILHGGEFDNVMTCGTAYGQVQLYDVRASSSVRRPTAYTPDNMLSHRITSMCQMGDSTNILAVGDTIGDIHLLDIRKLSAGRYQSSARKSKTGSEDIGFGRLAGPGGSIRQLVNHPSKPNVLACVGLDRKLWTWDITKKKKNGMKKPLDCVYLKQRLNCILFCEDGDGTENKTDNDYEESGMDGHDFDDERNELDEDAVEDYIDSDDDDNNNNRCNKQSDAKEKALQEEETESESDENGSSDDDDEEDDNNDGSGSSIEDVDEPDDEDVESSESCGDDEIASKRRRT